MLLVVRETFTDKEIDWFDTDYEVKLTDGFCSLLAGVITKAHNLADKLNMAASAMESDLHYIVETYENREQYIRRNNAS